MNAGPTVERVHDALRQRIMRRDYRPGDRLDPAVLAAPLSSSVTPVRDALHLLTGEGLVETRTSGGFYIPALDEPALKDRYDWSAQLLVLAIRAWPDMTTAIMPTAMEALPSIADRTGAIFLAIASRSANGEHRRAIDRLNARLHAVRSVETHLLDDIEAELAAIVSAAAHGERDRLRRLILVYHRRRHRAAAAIVRAVYRVE